MRLNRRTAWGAVGVAAALLLAGCSSDDGGGSDEPAASDSAGGDLTPVKLQLQWFTQAQFAGYYAAAPHAVRLVSLIVIPLVGCAVRISADWLRWQADV